MIKNIISYKEVSELFDHNCETGEVTWAVSKGAAKKGSPAGCLSNGYLLVRYNGKLVRLHRVIMSLILRRDILQDEVVDHVNGDKLDNSRGNLRVGSSSQNNQNQRVRKNNTSGYKGVSWCSPRDTWVVHIREFGKSIYVGASRDLKEAARMYDAEATRRFGDWALTNSDLNKENYL